MKMTMGWVLRLWLCCNFLTSSPRKGHEFDLCCSMKMIMSRVYRLLPLMASAAGSSLLQVLDRTLPSALCVCVVFNAAPCVGVLVAQSLQCVWCLVTQPFATCSDVYHASVLSFNPSVHCIYNASLLCVCVQVCNSYVCEHSVLSWGNTSKLEAGEQIGWTVILSWKSNSNQARGWYHLPVRSKLHTI